MIPEEQLAKTDTTLERLLFLSDGVFAIAITLLVLEIVPEIQTGLPEARLPEMFLGLLRPIVTYALSFIIISIYWTTHQRTFQYIQRSDTVLIWLNIFFLMNVAFLPIPTKVIQLYGDHQAAVIFYIGSLTIPALLSVLLWWYATYDHRLVDKHLDAALIRHQLQRSLIAPIIFLLSIGLSFISPYLTEASWLLIGVVIIIHERLYHRRIAKQQKKSTSSQPLTLP
ncbi:MAG: TMEM175 family protein [Chloroflexota bacterium]|nr:TMEM175 family protein [Chloroflexota bacterium]